MKDSEFWEIIALDWENPKEHRFYTEEGECKKSFWITTNECHGLCESIEMYCCKHYESILWESKRKDFREQLLTRKGKSSSLSSTYPNIPENEDKGGYKGEVKEDEIEDEHVALTYEETDVYWWPHDREGAMTRASIARELAEECRREEEREEEKKEKED